jgi:hypothetical protein
VIGLAALSGTLYLADFPVRVTYTILKSKILNKIDMELPTN